MTITNTEYNKIKKEFFKKHKNSFETHTSRLDEYGGYHKEYVFDDNAIWYEVYSVEYITKEVSIIADVTKIVDFKMFRTEFWSSDNAKSYYVYENY